jgi:antitoxin component of MazEF toxin-antitoxin module
MKLIQKAIKVGSSVAAVLPKSLLKQTGITAGTAITVEAVEDGVLIRPVKPHARAKTDDEKVAETALDLMNRYKSALERLADA